MNEEEGGPGDPFSQLVVAAVIIMTLLCICAAIGGYAAGYLTK